MVGVSKSHLSSFEIHDELHARDQWQIEIEKDLLIPLFGKKHFLQEIYIFLPTALQVTHATYPKERFYHDRVHLIRFKTPTLSLEELLHRGDPRSPFTLVEQLVAEYESSNLTKEKKQELEEMLLREFQLAANIIRSQLRTQTSLLFNQESGHNEAVLRLLEVLDQAKSRFFILSQKVRELPSQVVHNQLPFIQEGLSRSIEELLLQLAAKLEQAQLSSSLPSEEVLQKVANEKKFLVENFYEPEELHQLSEEEQETFLYRRNLLTKFLFSPLLLNLKTTFQGYGELIASMAAGVAMMFYLLFFFWRGALLIDSLQLVVITSLLYVLKDRLKDGMKSILHKQARRLFDDQQYDIITSDGTSIGRIGEHFQILPQHKVAQEIVTTRFGVQRQEEVSSLIPRPEVVLYYKKHITLSQSKKHPQKQKQPNRNFDLHAIFRLSLQNLFQKASDPLEAVHTYNPKTKSPELIFLPKAYHLNVVIKTTDGLGKKQSINVEKFRIIADKYCIKRID